MKGSSLGTAIGIAMTVLTGCGGGGYGGGGGSGNLNSAPGAAALTAYVQANHSGTLHATDSAGGSWTFQYSATATTTTGTFNGTPNAYSTATTITLTRNGTQVATGTSTSYYLLNAYMPLGSVTSTGTPYEVVTTFSPLPATVTVGNSGSYETLTYYHDSTKSVMDATETDTYSVSVNDSTTLLVCIDSTIAGVTTQGTTDGLAPGTETDCYTVDASGNAALLNVTVTVSAGTLKFQ